MSETSSLTGPLLKMYEEAGALAFRMPVGRLQKGKHWIQLCKEGTADILVFPRKGGVVWVECKDPTGSTKKSRREAQHAFKSIVEALGHKYYLVHSIDDGMRAL